MVTKYEYNAHGLMAQERREIGGNAFDTGFSYDWQGNLLSITYPDNSVAAYQYNEAGQLELVAFTDAATGQSRNIVKDFDYAPTGQARYKLYGNNVETSTTYDPTTLYRLERIETRAATGTASYAAPEELHRESLFGKIMRAVISVLLGSPETAYAAEEPPPYTVGATGPAAGEDGWRRNLTVGKDITFSASEYDRLTKRGWNYVWEPLEVTLNDENGAIGVTKYRQTFGVQMAQLF